MNQSLYVNAENVTENIPKKVENSLEIKIL